MLAQEKKYFTPEEYLELEEKAEYKSEYYQGEIFAMSGGSVNHCRIAINVQTGLNVAFRKRNCEVFNGDMRVLVQENGLYTYPDVSAICGEIKFAEGRNDTVTNPCLIVEVLSKSTKDYDRGQKFELYRALPSLEDYVLIHQDKVHVEHFHKQSDGKWLFMDICSLEENLVLESVDVTLPIRDLYEKVDRLSESTDKNTNL
ncbi:protein of unknown function DUF820 [Chloroherpeton thalassium ATCC 35110]|uniref:Putative restriction endonuclease domain-containing protein n=1 Tax=Chloroherpeton thalassium (strain ATCC 35110 / GB-78) TaxID=517418 RepID=B3QV78_CHLT3|nr:Uma2 family endonuclease [Chloroherpeton thalassium]ACF13032.1 protein of unknown function DUF820 [Chloroherpeton thalassium ATCC 35110]